MSTTKSPHTDQRSNLIAAVFTAAAQLPGAVTLGDWEAMKGDPLTFGGLPLGHCVLVLPIEGIYIDLAANLVICRSGHTCTNLHIYGQPDSILRDIIAELTRLTPTP